MSDADKTPATLLTALASLDPQERREVAATLRNVSETFAEVADGQKAGFVLGVVARLLDPA
jgi:hypothetical protein